MHEDSLHGLPAAILVDRMLRRELTSVEVTEHFLERIERHGGSLGAFLSTRPERALERAEKLDTRAEAPGVVFGLPMADKDLLRRAGEITTFGSAAFRHYRAAADDPLVTWMDAAGQVSVGKTNTPEFGMTSYTENRLGAPAETPWMPGHSAGGSSGGAAAAVSAGLLPMAIGSDGGGSIRIPASATGIVGLKPSRGRARASGGQATPGGLATAGVLARSVEDAALGLDALISHHGAPVSSQYATEPPHAGVSFRSELRAEVGRLRIGMLLESPWQYDTEIRIDHATAEGFEWATAKLASFGHELEDASLPDSHAYSRHFRTVWQSGAAGIQVPELGAKHLEPLTKWLMDMGRRISAVQLGESLTWLTAFERQVIEAFAAFDVVVSPTLALIPRPNGWYGDDPEIDFLRQCQYSPFTSFVNVAGLPAISVPVNTQNRAPVGVQIIGRPGGEAAVLRVAAQVERATRGRVGSAAHFFE